LAPSPNAPRCPECGSASFKAKDIDERTVQISCAKCGWIPPVVKIDQLRDREALK
jgi:ribosomal protein S27AE